MRQIGVLFPGQGNQYVGMLDKLLLASTKVKELVEMTDSILGYELSKIIANGPTDLLMQTNHAQPAIVLTSLCHWERQKELDAALLQKVKAIAGHSIGEYSALAASGYLTNEIAIKLAALRGQTMAKYGKGKGDTVVKGLMAVIKLADEKDHEKVIQWLNDHLDPLGASIAAINSSKQIVISGAEDKVMSVKDNLERSFKLWSFSKLNNVGSAFHSPLMELASRTFAVEAGKLLIKEKDSLNYHPSIPIISNVSGKELFFNSSSNNNIDGLVKGMAEQIVKPVKWKHSIENMINTGCNQLFPLGPDEATSEFLPAAQADFSKNLEICDLIKSRQVQAKDAMRAIKRRLQNRNPNIQLLALELTDTTIKNTSYGFLKELSSREFVDAMIELCKCPIETVAKNAKEKLQNWSMLLTGQDGLGYVKEALEQAKREGIQFPSPSSSYHLPPTMVKTIAPPEWTDNDSCQRCNVEFSIMLRKHHCRRCGKTFCQDCSSKAIALPELGLYEDVRVCESCYAEIFSDKSKINNTNHTNASKNNEERPLPAINETNDNFDDDLAKAIQLSLQGTLTNNNNNNKASSPTVKKLTETDYNEEAALAAAIAESLKESNENVDSFPFTITKPVIAESINEKGSFSSFATTMPGVNTKRSVSLLITPLERENVQLFNELVSRMTFDDNDDLEDPDFLKLARDMINLRDKLQKTLAVDKDSIGGSLDKILIVLETALARYELLATGGADHMNIPIDKDNNSPVKTLHSSEIPPNVMTVPTRPRSHTGSIMYIDPSKRPIVMNNMERSNNQSSSFIPPPPPSSQIIPVLQPQGTSTDSNSKFESKLRRTLETKTEPESLIPLDDDDGDDNLRDHQKTKKPDPLAELIEDQPLIQL